MAEKKQEKNINIPEQLNIRHHSALWRVIYITLITFSNIVKHVVMMPKYL